MHCHRKFDRKYLHLVIQQMLSPKVTYKSETQSSHHAREIYVNKNIALRSKSMQYNCNYELPDQSYREGNREEFKQEKSNRKWEKRGRERQMLLGEESRCSWKSWVFMTFLKEEGPPCFNSEQNQAKYFPGRLDNFHIPLWVKAGALYASPVLCLGTLCSSIQCYYVKGQNLM